MTFIEFAENVLGIELLDWQKSVLEIAQEHKDEGKSFHIHTYARQGKMLVNDAIQQKLGYDRGYEQAFEELKSLLRCRNYRGCVAGKGCDGICRIDSDICKNCENFGIPYSLLAEWQKENTDKSTIIIDEWLQSPSQTLKKEADKFVEMLEETSSIRLPEKEVKE